MMTSTPSSSTSVATTSKSASYWSDDILNRRWQMNVVPAVTFQSAPVLPSNAPSLHCDVVVVGGGITGVTTAAMLKKKGKKVILLEAGKIGFSGTTCSSSAHLTTLPDARMKSLIKTFGINPVKDYVYHVQDAVTMVGRMQKEFGFSNDYKTVPNYLIAENATYIKEFNSEVKHLKEVGLQVEEEATDGVPFPAATACKIMNQAQFHPSKHVIGIAKFVNGEGSNVYENARVIKWKDSKGSAPCQVTLENGTKITSDDIVLATHSPIGTWLSLHGRISTYRSYLLLAELQTPIPDVALYDDMCDPYHYIRVIGDNRRQVLVGGCDIQMGRGDSTKAYQDLENYLRSHFVVDRITHHWSANLFNSPDGFPYIGLGVAQKHVYVATGFQGCGLALGTLSGSMICDLIVKNSHPLARMLAPSRVSVIGTMLMSAPIQYHAMGSLFQRMTIMGDANKIAAELPINEGTIVRKHGKVLAIYKKEDGNISACSGTCTHMGCTLTWNSNEKTWDCPCHGSMYDKEGKVLSAPAPANLEHIDW